MQLFDPVRGGDLRETFEEVVLGWPDVEVTTMFGCPSYRASGVLFAVLMTDGVVLTKLPEQEWKPLDVAFETGPFEGVPRPPNRWVQVEVDAPMVVDLVPFVRESYEAALVEAK